MKKVLIGALCFLAVACTFKQDPFENYPDAIKGGRPPSKKQEDGRPVAPNIDVNGDYSVKESSTMKITISTRVYDPGLQGELFIDNLKDFTGATFDSSSGIFQWTPPEGFVKGNYQDTRDLHIVYATKTKPVYFFDKTVKINIFRYFAGPIIETVTGLDPNQIVYEDKFQTFNVMVRTHSSADTAPSLSVEHIGNGRVSGAGFVTMADITPEQDPLDKALWKFTLNFDLTGVDVTDSYLPMEFGLVAATKYKEFSQRKDMKVLVYTSILMPEITWEQPLKFTAEKENTYEFKIFDPRNEGRLSLYKNDCTEKAPENQCSCFENSNRSLSCTIHWTPKKTDQGKDFNFELTVRNESRIFGDSRYQEKVFSETVHVE